ncbi:MAG: thioredoxin family protein [Gammaproteobacteria bacterium]|nr:thioredoxin family protein [Gammaproteobacteria bacterium]
MNPHLNDAPDTLLLIATGCAHCSAVLEGLNQLVKEGVIGRLEVINIAVQPERAQELNVRSVPWTQVGPFVLEGQHTPAELRKWAQAATSLEGIGSYISEQLKQGQLEKTEQFFRQYPDLLQAIIPLLENEDTEMQIRIGLDVVMESLSGSDILQTLLPELGRLSEIDNTRIRGDITHYLSLTQHADAIPFLKQRLNDDFEDIREIAAEGLESIQESLKASQV